MAERSTVLTEAEEAAVVAFRRYTLLPLDDGLYALQPSIPHLTRSALHRRLQRCGSPWKRDPVSGVIGVGCLPFAHSGGQLLFHLISKL